MKLTLVDRSTEVVAALRSAFEAHPEVDVREGDLLASAQGAVVSPANSYGYMDGGIDRSYLEFFGARLERDVQKQIDHEPGGMLPVGAALLVRTGHPRIQYLVVAPTMELPRSGDHVKVFFAMAAILNLARRYPEQLAEVYCPGLGTGVGGVDPQLAAQEMANAYAKGKTRAS